MLDLQDSCYPLEQEVPTMAKHRTPYPAEREHVNRWGNEQHK